MRSCYDAFALRIDARITAEFWNCAARESTCGTAPSVRMSIKQLEL